MSASHKRVRGRDTVARGERVAVALDARLPLMELGKGGLRKAFPDHWSFLLGELALYSFLVLVLTGVYLTFFFEPGVDELPYTGRYQQLQPGPFGTL
ncbi:hypothetical protein [Streptomyces sp. S465]|uniref:hypothetical protein n=1 Tax=Streptomyces sp. S465 TaxID=2979468 RepID=UPI003FCE19C6